MSRISALPALPTAAQLPASNAPRLQLVEFVVRPPDDSLPRFDVEPLPFTGAQVRCLRVSALDRLLGGAARSIEDLLDRQTTIISRQECALRAIEACRLDPTFGPLPRYLVNPLRPLAYGFPEGVHPTTGMH